MLRRPDLFKVAVAGAPVVDWHDYDTHYTERYLDLPEQNPEAYRVGQPAHLRRPELRRPLLLVHGTADDNVYFFHSLKLADALFRAGRRFEFLPLPGVTHQIGDAHRAGEGLGACLRFSPGRAGRHPLGAPRARERGSRHRSKTPLARVLD